MDIRALALAFFAACLAPLAALAAEPGPTGAQPLLPRTDVPGLPNFAQVAPGLYRSGQPTAEGMRTAEKLGIKTIINLRTFHSDRALIRGTGLQYVHIFAKAWHPEEEDVVAFLKVAQDPARQPVLVHCQHGADRTGMMVASWRMVVEGWPLEDALAELPRFGFHEVWTTIRGWLGQINVPAIRAKVGPVALKAPAQP